MGKKYFDTKEGTLESSVLGVWKDAAEMSEQGFDGRTKSYKEHRAKLEAARARREEKKMDKVNPKALKKDFDDRKDKDIDNDGDVDDSDEYLHNRRKTVAKAVKKEEVELEEKVEYVEYKFRNKNDAMKAKAMLDAVQLMSFDVEDDDISNGELRVDAGKKDMTKYHKEIMKKFRPKVMTQEKVDESYEIGTDEYRDHTLEVTPGQSLTWGSANAYKQASMKEALAKVWGLDEKVLDKSEEDDKIAPVKGKKSMTGGKVADIDVDPEMKKEGK